MEPELRKAMSMLPRLDYTGPYGVSVDRPEFVSAGLKRFPLDHGGPLRSQLMVNQYDWRDSSSVSRYSMHLSSGPDGPQA